MNLVRQALVPEPVGVATNRLPRGLLHMAGAAFFFSLMSVCVKFAGRTLPASEIVLARAVISLVLSWASLRALRIPLWGKRKGLLLTRGLFGFLGLLCFFFALTRLPLAEVTVIHFTNPVLTALLAALFLGEEVRPGNLVGLALSLAGAVLVARPAFLFGGGAALDLAGVTAAFGGAVFSALAYVTVRKLGQTEHPLVVVFYFPLVAAPASVPLLHDAVWPGPAAWLALLGVGVATQIAQILLTQGLRAERAGRAMAMSYVQIPLAVLWGVLFFAERPGWWVLAGAALVFAGMGLATRERRAVA